MELLIPGLILVALMVYASTKIKKNAAKAYDEEVIENERFRLTKPEGFINPVEPVGDAIFSAYTRDFGTEESAEMRLAAANIYFSPGKSIADRQPEIAGEVEVVNTRSFHIGQFPAMLLEGTHADNSVKFASFYKFIEDENDLYELRVEILEDEREKFVERVEKMMDSFELR